MLAGAGGEVDYGGVAAVGALVEGATETGSEQALQRHRGDVGDGVQAVLGERGRRPRADAGAVRGQGGAAGTRRSHRAIPR